TRSAASQAAAALGALRCASEWASTTRTAGKLVGLTPDPGVATYCMAISLSLELFEAGARNAGLEYLSRPGWINCESLRAGLPETLKLCGDDAASRSGVPWRTGERSSLRRCLRRQAWY